MSSHLDPTTAADFVRFAYDTGALRFGDFVTKSGRKTPYFFNAGDFSTGSSIARLGDAYAAALVASGVEFDMLFGPAYKGITLATATSIGLARLGRDVPFAFNRKEAKDHGEGGLLVGAPLAGRVVIVDDVITDGAAKREAVEIIRAAGAEPAAVLIALDRAERVTSDLGSPSAVQAFTESCGVPVISIISAHMVSAALRSWNPGAADAITTHLTEFGVGNGQVG
jgi:orotate phosphoribosyltransferase